MDRRPLSVLLALGLIGAVPSAASATSVDRLLAATPQTGTLTSKPSANLVAQAEGGTLTSKPKASGTKSTSSTSSTVKASASTATSLPYTGSDPRITLMLGFAAILLGAGLRMRTGDARDF